SKFRWVRMGSIIKLGFWLGLAAALVACAPSTEVSLGGPGASATLQGPREADYCSTAIPYSSPVTISGTANFIRRDVFGNAIAGGLGSASLSGPHSASLHPIRYAEVRVTDALGNLAQCAE